MNLSLVQYERNKKVQNRLGYEVRHDLSRSKITQMLFFIHGFPNISGYRKGLSFRKAIRCAGLFNIVLDIGCGAGEYALYLAKKSALVVGLDITDLSNAKQKAKLEGINNITFVEADFREFEDNHYKYDFINCIEFFIHLGESDRFAAIDKIYNLLQFGGFLYVHSSSDFPVNFSKLCDVEEKKRHKGAYWTKEEMEKVLKQRGFEIVTSFKTYGLFGKLGLNLSKKFCDFKIFPLLIPFLKLIMVLDHIFLIGHAEGYGILLVKLK